jgi:putative inorganic carbon (HCO3(-)) transporter
MQLFVVLALTLGSVVIVVFHPAGPGMRNQAIALGGLLGGAALLALAIFRFDWFVLATLLIRPTVDWSRSSTSATQSGGAATALAGILVGAGTAWLIVNCREHRISRGASKVSVAFGAFVGICFVSAIDSNDPQATAVQATRLLSVLVLLLLLERMTTSEADLRRLIAVCYASAIPPVIVGMYQAVGGGGAVKLVKGISRVRGTFSHPNSFGIFLALLIVMGVAIWPRIGGRERFWLTLLLAPSSALLVLTYSRSSWAGAILGITIVGMLQSRRLILALLIAGLLAVLLIPSVSSRVTDVEAKRHANQTAADSFTWRLDYWNESLSEARNPITGIGLGMTGVATGTGKPPHSDPVRAYVELGVLGVLAYVTLVLSLIALARHSVRRAQPSFDRGVANGFAGCTGCLIAASLAGNIVTQPVFLWTFFAFAAAARAVVVFANGDPTESGRSRRQAAVPPLDTA